MQWCSKDFDLWWSNSIQFFINNIRLHLARLYFFFDSLLQYTQGARSEADEISLMAMVQQDRKQEDVILAQNKTLGIPTLESHTLCSFHSFPRERERESTFYMHISRFTSNIYTEKQVLNFFISIANLKLISHHLAIFLSLIVLNENSSIIKEIFLAQN